LNVKLQLLIFLYKLSSSVPSGNFFTIGKYFKVSKANARSCFLCVLTAVLVFEKEVISWPSAEEKKLSQRFYATYGLPKCIGIVDGALLFLAETPEWSREDFNT